MTLKLIRTLLAAMALLVSMSGRAADTDLFVGASTSSSTEVPNVLILLDNTANWSTPFTNEISALSSVISGLPANKFRVGLMMFTETGGGNSNADGAYVRAAMRLMDSTNKTKLQNLVNSFNKVSDRSNGGKLGKTMVEVHRYLSGGTPYAGNNKAKTDYTGNSGVSTASDAIYALSGNALTAKAGTTYTNPIVAACAKTYVIYISNGAAQDNTSDTTAATTELSNAGGNTSAIVLSPSGSQTNVGDEWARFLKTSALGVTMYTVDIDKVTTGQGPGWSKLLQSMATVSGGKYFDVSSGVATNISNALNKIFSEIQSVNSVFASVSLPVSVNTQGTYLNQVFVGMFRPDADAYPRWTGNLKQYKLGFIGTDLKLLDASGASAVNNLTGFISECAGSYWTPSTVDTEWSTQPRGACLAVANSDISNYPDGNIVEKGAQAYVQRASSSRTVKTCTPSACTTLTDFNNTNVTQTMLGAASTTERDALINWAVGKDVDDEDLDGTTTAERRLSLHGDVVHSRPVAINYGTEASPQVVVYYGANDGTLRAVNGNRTLANGTVGAGQEFWAFVPPEAYTHIKRQRDNTIPVSFIGNTTGTPTPQAKPYSMDGSMAALKTASTAWLYASMRRGGRHIYAFDVTTPSSPTLKWRKGCPNASNDTDCSASMSDIGQTWSSPKVMYAQGYGGGTSPLLTFGGGHDDCEDNDPHTCTSTSKGKRIYFLDADTGAFVTSFTTERGVVGDINVLTDADGKATYAYAGDMGGNVYRITFGNGAPASWTMTKIASLGCSTTASCPANRKFMFAPDVVTESGVNILLIGSGDREKPLTAYTTTITIGNKFYMLKDKPSDSGWFAGEAASCEGNALICNASLLSISGNATVTVSAVDAKKGWSLDLSSQEQVVTAAITLFGITTFSTHTPAQPVVGSCASNLGTARVYNVGYLNAAPENADRSSYISGGGLPPSPVAGSVRLDSGQLVEFVIGASPDSPLEAKQRVGTTASTGQPKTRVYWYRKR